MHLFFDTVWKLHIGEIPEKPILFEHRDQDYTSQYVYDDYYASLKVYNEAIAAIKQNALTVGNPEILNFEHGEEYDTVIINGDEINKGEFYKWPGGYETKEIKDGEIRITAGGHPFLGSKTVAILTLPEEKKNTMENFKKFDLNEPHGTTASGSVAAPKEEGLNIPWDSDYYESRIKELKEALKELLPLIEESKRLSQECIMDYDEVKFCPIRQGEGNQCRHCFDKAIIDRARKLISK